MRLDIVYDILVGIEKKEISNEANKFVQRIHQTLDNWFIVDYSYVNLSKHDFEVKFILYDEHIIDFVNYLMNINSRKELAHLKLNREMSMEFFYKIQEFNILED